MINPQTIPTLRAPILAGGANNILAEESRDMASLMERGITYVPDYVINGGGLISVNAELHGWTKEKAMEDSTRIFDTVKAILMTASEKNISPLAAADEIANARLNAVSGLRNFYLGD